MDNRPTVDEIFTQKRWIFFRSTLLASLLGLGASALASAADDDTWWHPEWPLRKPVTFSPGADLAEPVANAAVLLRLHDGNFNFAATKEDASDWRFVAEDDKTVLPHHLERYDALLNEAFVWIRLPEVKAGGDTTFWFYYGNAGPNAVKAENPQATYAPDTALVYHFNEADAPAQDSAGGNHHAETPTVPSAGALIGGGAAFDGMNAIVIPAAPALAWTAGDALTWSAWINPAADAPNGVIFSRGEGETALRLGLQDGALYLEAAGQRTPTDTAQPVPAGSWHHVAFTAQGAQLTIFLAGEIAAVLPVALPALDGPLRLGAPGEGGSGFTGDLDELRIDRVARPAAALKLAFLNQGGGDHTAAQPTFGPDEQPKNWLSWLEGGYMGVIIKNLTFDGWIVIVILAVMAVISWWVKISKFGYLQRVSKGNARFLKEWRHLADDFTELENGEVKDLGSLGGRVSPAEQKLLRHAPLLRLYKAGAEEIRHRLALRPDQPRSLSTRAIQAIRASLDGTFARETQRLNRGIVLLTIAISGGPFLGLLGTVVGVMITFAAVAAAGDVNVNAIAPGIAAALLATVAGLAVAIPALFGYNYLLSKIKEANTDMQVFIDEFITRMAEFYRGGPPD